MAQPKKNIVLLGGSYGGIATAHCILKHVVPNLPEKESYQVVIVSASSEAMCRPACPRALISDEFFDQSKLFVSVPAQFEQYPQENFRFVHGTVTQLDHTKRSVTVDVAGGGTETLDFYALVIATGSSTPSPLFSFNKNEQHLKDSWKEFRTALASAKSIVIAGGGPTGIETAGELGEHLNGRAGFFSSKIENPKVSITVVTSAAQILPILRTSIAESAEKLLAKVGVTIIKNAKVTSVSPDKAGTSDALAEKATVTLDNGQTLEADLYIPAFGTNPNTSFVDKSLLTPDGRVETNTSTLRVDKAGERIYAIGDASSYSRPAIHLLTEAVPFLLANIKRDLYLDAGKDEKEAGPEKQFKEDKRETHLVPIGRSKGVGAGMGYQFPSLLVWAVKGRDYWLWMTGPYWSGKQWAKAA